MDTQLRETLKNKKRVIVKIGSSSLLHEETGKLNLLKLERLVRELCDIKNQGMDVCLVSSGAIAVGNSCKTGMCGSGTGETYDDLSKAFFRVPPECGTGSYDKKNYG